MSQENLNQADALPLSNITVLDLTLARAGPTCVRHLADWGANVIRVESPATGGEDVTGNRNGPDFQNLHRNKRVISLDLKSPQGHAAFMRLASRADVIVENMRPTVKHKLKVAWDDVRKVNPRLVYGSISGFGQTGPHATRAGVDPIVQAMAGLMSITGQPECGPVRVGIAISDTTSGNLLALGIMMALFQRQTTGVGRWVHTSLLESQIFMLDFQASRWLMKGEVAGLMGNDHPTLTPSGSFASSDGMIVIGASGTRVWRRLCAALDRPDWLANADWDLQAGRTKHKVQIKADIEAITKTKPSAYWIEVLNDAGVPCGAVNTIDQVFAEPQVKHLGMAAAVTSSTLGPIKLVASPLNMEGLSKALRCAAPEPGTHTEEVLREAGFSAQEVEELRLAHAI